MKETLRLVVVTTVFCLVAGLLLAWTNTVTKVPIEAARKAELLDALKRVLPPCDNDVVADAKVFRENDTEWTYYVAKNKGEYVGTAFVSGSKRGYGGTVKVLVGLRRDGTVNDLEILAANETPGLGMKVKESKFRAQFKGRGPVDTKWAAVKKDGGDIQAVTGATISSRAVTEAVKAGLDTYAKHADDITGVKAEK